jgi:hypothetical protein
LWRWLATFGRNLPFICEYLYRAFVHEQTRLGARNIHRLEDRPMTLEVIG